MRLVGISLLVLAAAAVLSGCTTQFKDITVGTETDPDVDLKTYETYMWAAAAAVVRDPDRTWTPPDLDLGAEIAFLVDRELRSKGLAEVVDAPDLLAIYAVGVDMMSLNITVDEQDKAQFEEVPKGGIVIVLADAETRAAVWAGAAVAELLEKPDREQTKKRIDYAITKMFRDFPRTRRPMAP